MEQTEFRGKDLSISMDQSKETFTSLSTETVDGGTVEHSSSMLYLKENGFKLS